MSLETKKEQPPEEKVWENPSDPRESSDGRDKEQIIRQYEEAKRRKENLTEDDNTETKN
jgi:hypothetical protein